MKKLMVASFLLTAFKFASAQIENIDTTQRTDTIKVIAQIYNESPRSHIYVQMYYVKAWRIVDYYREPDAPGTICLNCNVTAHVVKYLRMNKREQLTRVWEANPFDWK